jgi:acyl dehydratase
VSFEPGVAVDDESDVVRREISVGDVLAFADLTGDHEPIHVDEAFARSTPYGKRLVHGVLLLGMMADRLLTSKRVAPNVSYGYDRLRFLRPVLVDSTVLLSSRVLEIREERKEVVIEESCRLEDGTLAAVAHHIFRFI